MVNVTSSESISELAGISSTLLYPNNKLKDRLK